MVSTMVKLNLLEKLDKTKIPNMKNIVKPLQAPSYDPTGDYSVIYTWGMAIHTPLVKHYK